MVRSIVLILIAIGLGIGGLLLWRSAIEDAGGFRLGLDVMWKQLAAIAGSWKFWVGGFLLLGVVLVSLELKNAVGLHFDRRPLGEGRGRVARVCEYSAHKNDSYCDGIQVPHLDTPFAGPQLRLTGAARSCSP